MYSKKTLISVLGLVVGLSVSAQSNSLVEVNYDRKVIYTDSLALPKSINVGALLRLLPELLARPDEYTLSNYEVQVDGVSVGEAADDVLAILQLEDVMRLEVNKSPTMSDLNNGQSGSINISLRPLASKPRGMSGTASLGVSTETTLTPNLLLDYHGERLSVRAVGFGEYFSQNSRSWQEGPTGWTLLDEERLRLQTVRASVYYRLDKSNDFAFTLSEGTSYDRQKDDFTIDAADSEADVIDRRLRERGVRLMSQLNYNHAFNSGQKLSASVKYSHNPMWNYSLLDGAEREDVQAKFKNDWQTQVALSDRRGFAQGRGSLTYKVGVKGSVKHTNNYSDTYALGQEQHKASCSEIRGLMPLSELTMAYGPLSMKLGAEYQWNSGENDDNWTGRLSLIWQMNRNNRMRLGLNRQLRYPDILAHESGIDYIGDFRWGSHTLTSNVGLSLCNIAVPKGKDFYYVGNVMGIYQYDKRFFLSVTANYYRRLQDVNEGKDGYYTYYNLSVMPSVILGRGWRVAANMRFFSHVLADKSHNNANAIWQVNGGKSWGAWNVYVYARRPMRKWNVNLDYEAGTAYYSQMIPTESVGAGVSYRM